jgi:hypothetical protein
MLARYASLIAALELAAIGATTAQAVAASGLHGVVTRSPITPVCMEGVPCSAPAKNTPLVFFRPGKRVRTRTDGTGRYRVALAPGRWRVRTATVPRIGSGISPHSVRVFAARFRAVDFDIDRHPLGVRNSS